MWNLRFEIPHFSFSFDAISDSDSVSMQNVPNLPMKISSNETHPSVSDSSMPSSYVEPFFNLNVLNMTKFNYTFRNRFMTIIFSSIKMSFSRAQEGKTLQYHCYAIYFVCCWGCAKCYILLLILDSHLSHSP